MLFLYVPSCLSCGSLVLCISVMYKYFETDYDKAKSYTATLNCFPRFGYPKTDSGRNIQIKIL